MFKRFSSFSSRSMGSPTPISSPRESTSSDSLASATRTCMGYTIGELLGSGGFSWVLEGHKGGKTVALKFIKVHNSTGKFKRQRKEVSVELDILKTIRHENIIRLHAFRQTIYETPDGKKVPCYCFAMESCHRLDLFDYLYHSGKFEESLARRIFQKVVAGVAHLHKHGYAHRDLKAQNILLTDDFEVKIIDFGGSKLVANGLMQTFKVGTRGYQAPEVLLKRPYTKRCDVFSAGVMLFIMVTCHPPFRQALISDPWFRTLAKAPANYQKFWQAHKKDVLSKSLRSIIERMLCYQPVHRFKIQQVQEHEWIKNPGLSDEAYFALMTERRDRCAEQILICDKSPRTENFAGMY